MHTINKDKLLTLSNLWKGGEMFTPDEVGNIANIILNCLEESNLCDKCTSRPTSELITDTSKQLEDIRERHADTKLPLKDFKSYNDITDLLEIIDKKNK